MNKILNYLEKSNTVILLSIFMSFIIAALVLFISGYNPSETFKYFIKGVFSKPRYIVQAIIVATPVIITGLSVLFAFKVGLFNIGVEGQFIIGSIVASFLGIKLSLPCIIHPIVIILISMLFAGLFGAVIGILKAKYGINEVLVSIMLNWIALYFNNYYYNLPGILKEESGASYEIRDSAKIKILYYCKNNIDSIIKFKEKVQAFKEVFNNSNFIDKVGNIFQDIILKTDVNYGIFISIILAILLKKLFDKTTFGYEMKAVGTNKYAAEASGINIKKCVIVSMFISGAISGLGGAIYITGMSPNKIMPLSTFENYGFNGLSVALMANLNMIYCIFSGLLFGVLIYGGSSIQAAIGVPSEIVNIIIGVIIFFIGIKLIFNLIINKLSKGENIDE